MTNCIKRCPDTKCAFVVCAQRASEQSAYNLQSQAANKNWESKRTNDDDVMMTTIEIKDPRVSRHHDVEMNDKYTSAFHCGFSIHFL